MRQRLLSAPYLSCFVLFAIVSGASPAKGIPAFLRPTVLPPALGRISATPNAFTATKEIANLYARRSLNTSNIDDLGLNPAPIQGPHVWSSSRDHNSLLWNSPQSVLGAVSDGVPVQCAGVDDSVALTAAVTAARGGWVVIARGQTCAGRDLAIPNLHVAKGGLLKPVTSHAITISGSFDAGPYQTFNNALPGQGTISFSGSKSVAAVFPQWWGGAGDGSTDCTAAIQSAINAAGSLGQGSGDLESFVFFLPGIYVSGNLAIDRAAVEYNNRIGLLGSGTRSTVILAKPGTSQLLLIQGNGTSQVSSGILIRDLQFQGNNLPVPLLKLKNLGFSRLENVTFQNNQANAMTLERVIQTTFDQLYFANVGTTGTRKGVILIDTGTADAGSELRFRDVVIEAFKGRGIEFVQTNPSIFSTYQVVFDNLKIEDGGDGRTSAAGDYMVIVQKADHVKFVNSFFASKLLSASGTVQNGQIYVSADVNDLVFSNTVFFNNADLGQPTAITSYVYIDGNTKGVRFISPFFRETHFRQSYCLYANGSADNIAVVAPEFINWNFNPVIPLNLSFSNSPSKVSVLELGNNANIGTLTLSGTTVSVNGNTLNPALAGTTGPIGGAIRGIGCDTGTANVPGATTSMVAVANAVAYPGDGVRVSARVTSAGVVTVHVCSDVPAKPTPSIYLVRVLP